MSQPSYAINRPRVVFEDVENEILVIDTVTGSYFSIADTGSNVWQRIDRGCTVDDIVDSLIQGSGSSRQQVAEDVDCFVQDLVRNDLVVPSDATDAASASEDTAELNIDYSPPVLTKYTDLQDLLLVDPIHDVTEGGWPHRK